ncbi:NAD-dependent epimerase/dehydratase family protein [Agrococcus citreus]|uniref:SDR family oxidoreductase n=1 Tax=Agrococcus citreus TaxID=84643 RepID=A0ABN1YTU6_9MICO
MTVAIFGASGLVGAAAVDAFLAAGERVVAVSRRAPELLGGGEPEHLPLDLLDGDGVREAIGGRGDITHVVYAAVHEQPDLVRGWRDREQMETNLRMIRSALEPLIASGSLAHVSLLQGTKAYGAHLHPIRVPAREREPRDAHENFYWLQEDYVREEGERSGFAWTIFRPPLIVGPTYGVAMNLVPVIGAYAAIRAAEGLPFTYPGGPSYVAEAVDTEVLAQALVWASRAAEARDEHFNISNGEVFQWRDLWPAFAEELGVEAGPDERFRISEYLLRRTALWEEIVARRGLRPLALPELLGRSHLYADFQFAAGAKAPPPPALLSTVKLHEAGFHGVRDTELSFRRWFRVLVERRIIPG